MRIHRDMSVSAIVAVIVVSGLIELGRFTEIIAPGVASLGYVLLMFVVWKFLIRREPTP